MFIATKLLNTQRDHAGSAGGVLCITYWPPLADQTDVVWHATMELAIPQEVLEAAAKARSFLCIRDLPYFNHPHPLCVVRHQPLGLFISTVSHPSECKPRMSEESDREHY